MARNKKHYNEFGPEGRWAAMRDGSQAAHIKKMNEPNKSSKSHFLKMKALDKKKGEFRHNQFGYDHTESRIIKESK